MTLTATTRRFGLIGATLGLLALPPLLGAWLAGMPLSAFGDMALQTRSAPQPPFSWPVFLLGTLIVAACCAPFLWRLYRAEAGAASDNRRLPLPWWGWLGLLSIALSWLLSRNLFPALGAWHHLFFTPLWLGYILLLNALSYRRRGHCLLLHERRRFLWLFPLSALFWWYFEYLNLFAHNWYYPHGASGLGAGNALSATLSFSTVLPAISSSRHWLGTFSRMNRAFVGLWPLRLRHSRMLALLGLLAASASMAGLGARPEYFYPSLWLAPFVSLLALLALSGTPTWFSRLARGDWRPFCQAALAGLMCGFFWELWNYGSLSHWEYQIPYVDRFRIFEMPLLGYSGYLTFGLACMLVAGLVLRPPAGAEESRAA